MGARTPAAALALGLLLLGTACAGPSPSGAKEASVPTGSGQLVLRVRDSAGLVPVAPAALLPRFSLYGDGRAVLGEEDGAQGWPAPREVRLSRAELAAVVSAAREAGLDKGGSAYTPPPDGATSSYLLAVGGRRQLTTAPGRAARDCGSAEHRALCALDERLRHLSGRSVPYRFEALAAVFHQTGRGGSPRAPRWPLGSLATAGERTGIGQCLVVRGEQLRRLERAVRAEPSPPHSFTDGTATYRVALRPLLPGERTCRDVAAVGREQ